MTKVEAVLLRSLFDCLAGYQRSLAEIGGVLTKDQVESLSDEARWDVALLSGLSDCASLYELYSVAEKMLSERKAG